MVKMFSQESSCKESVVFTNFGIIKCPHFQSKPVVEWELVTCTNWSGEHFNKGCVGKKPKQLLKSEQFNSADYFTSYQLHFLKLWKYIFN